MEKTVRELVRETGIDRSTLLKAAQAQRVPARQSGSTWLIDTSSEGYTQWLANLANHPKFKRKRKLAEKPLDNSAIAD